MGNWLQTWINVLTKPSLGTFQAEAERPDANLTTAIIWMAIAGVVAALVALIQGMFARAQIAALGGFDAIFNQANLPPELVDQITNAANMAFSRGTGFGGAVWALIVAIVGFLIFVGVIHVVVKALGGQGDYGRYAYQVAAFYAPLSIVAALLGLIPLVGGCLGFILWIYELVLAVIATQAEYKVETAKAIIALVIAVIVFAVVFGCIGGALASMLFF